MEIAWRNECKNTLGRENIRRCYVFTKTKREISEAVQKILRDTNHPELPNSEINFSLHVNGAESWSWADIYNNGAIDKPGVNIHNELQDRR